MIDDYYYDSKEFSPVNLGNSPEKVKEAVYNICRFLYDGWDTRFEEMRKECEELVKFFENADEILSEIIVLKEEDTKNLPVLVLQIAAFRFLRFHLPKIFDTLEKNNWKNSRILWNSYSLLKKVELEEWEKPFWLVASGQSLKVGISKVNPFMEEEEEEEPVRKGFEFGDCYDRCVKERIEREKKSVREEMINSAMKHKDIIAEIRKLQQKYEPYMLKAEKLNHVAKEYTQEQYEEKMEAVQKMKKILEVLEKNLSGELNAYDIVAVKKQLPEWEKSLVVLENVINELIF